MRSLARTAPHVAQAINYAQAIVDGKLPACKWVKLACERQLRDLDTWKSKSAPFYFDAAAAERVCDVVSHFPHIKGEWAAQRRHIDLAPWQSFVLSTVFGWKCRSTKTRRFRYAYIEVPRKNAKSTMTSALGNYLVACDDEAGAYVISAANTQKQANLVFGDAQLMARKEKGFLARFGIEVLAHVIAQPETASKFEALSAEYANLDGLNIHAALIDELHAHASRGLWDVLQTATGSRAQPIIWAITTAGSNRASVCYDQRLYVTKILERLLADESYFGVIYTIDDGDDPFDEQSWIKANPNYGVSIYEENLRTSAAQARVMPSAQNSFLMKHLDIWVNADVAWLPAGAWAKCIDADLNLAAFDGQPCYVGIDLASRSDFTAVMLYFPATAERAYAAVFGRYYLPQDTIERAENAHYQGWERSGMLVGTEGAVTDFDYVLNDLDHIAGAYDVREIVSDPWKNVGLVNALQARGVSAPIVDLKQSAQNMSPAMLEFEALVLARKIRHDGDPVLDWMLGNVLAHRNPLIDTLQPRKEAADKKIDGVTALLSCINRSLRQQAAEPAPDFVARGGFYFIPEE